MSVYKNQFYAICVTMELNYQKTGKIINSSLIS